MVDTLHPVNAVLGAPSYSGRALRQAASSMKAGAVAARPLGGLSGVRPGTSVTTVTATSTVWTCGPFAGTIDGEAAAEASVYEFGFDANATGAVTAASAFARRDLIYVQVDDPSESDGSTVPAVTRKYLAGSVASTLPTLPARSFPVAQINVPASGGGAPTVTWIAPYTVAAGATLPVPDATARAAYAPMDGQYCYQIDTGVTYARAAGAWKAWESDWITYTPTLANITLGTGSSTTFRYRYVGGIVQVRFNIQLGTGGSVGTGPTITLPVAHTTLFHSDQNLPGDLSYYDASTGTLYPGKVLMSGSSTTIAKLYHTNAGPYTGLTAAVPFTWTISDELTGTFEFVPA